VVRVIRARVDADLPACVAVLRVVHETDGYPTSWPTDPARWLDPKGLLGAWVAVDDGGAVVGHIALTVAREPVEPPVLAATGRTADGVASIARLYVDPSARGAGHAGALLDAATTAAHELGRVCVLDVVADGIAAIALYEHRGWERVASAPATWRTSTGERPLVHYYVEPAAADSPAHGIRGH
jgi:ribosomal protein S18 acetylase RimI-like enzyme